MIISSSASSWRTVHLLRYVFCLIILSCFLVALVDVIKHGGENPVEEISETLSNEVNITDYTNYNETIRETVPNTDEVNVLTYKEGENVTSIRTSQK